MAEGTDLAWLADDAALPLTANLVAALGLLTSWVGSVVVWARSTRRGIGHSLAIVALIFFGLFVGAFYVLVALRTVPDESPNEAAA